MEKSDNRSKSGTSLKNLIDYFMFMKGYGNYWLLQQVS
jgi:hypothetical protein